MSAEVIDFPRKAQPQAAPLPITEADLVLVRAAAAVAAFGHDPAFLDPLGRTLPAIFERPDSEEQ